MTTDPAIESAPSDIEHEDWCAACHDKGPCVRMREVPMIWSFEVHQSPKDVARGLRDLADKIEAEELTLISVYNTGFGEAWEAALQVVATYEEEVTNAVTT